MITESNSSDAGGVSFRDELVNHLRRYIDEGLENGFGKREDRLTELRNIVRFYVPTYSPPQNPDRGEGNWMMTVSFQGVFNRHPQLEREIKDLGEKIARDFDVSSKVKGREERLNKIFRDYGWKAGRNEPDTRMDYICPPEDDGRRAWRIDRRKAWRMDAVKDKIAVEVELSSRPQVFKDAFKFLIRQERGEIDAGVIMVRRECQKRSSEGKRSYPPTIKSVDYDMHAIVNCLPMVKMAFYGFPKRLNKDNKKNDVIA
jgi:hypothetical protein